MENSRGKGASAEGTAATTVGSVIAETYVIERVIGRGGMGTVFLASHKRLPGKQVAIKMLHVDADDARNEEVLHRFRHEAEIASTLGHPNIVKVDDFNTLPDGTPYLVLEYLEGETLARRLDAGPIALDQALSIVRQVGSALAAAHRAGIVHRDLKPHNIFLVPTEVDGELIDIAKVLDFGISKIKGSQTVKTQDSALLGTPQYMSPEQATGQHALVDERTDVFAFGSIVYEMLTGRAAFTGASIPEVVFKVVYEEPVALVDSEASPAIAAAVARAMAKSPADRFATVSELVEALTGQALLAPRTASVPPPETGATTGNVASREAFAHTMDSSKGDRRVVGTQRAASPVAETMVSQSRPFVKPKAPRPAGQLVAIGVAGAVVAAGVVYLVMRGGGGAPPVASDATVLAAKLSDAAVPDAARAVDAAPPADASPADAAVHVDAAVHAPVDAARSVSQKAIPPELLSLLAQARAAFARGDDGETIRLTDQVINRPDRPDVDEASLRARVIRVLLRCSQSDQSGAEAEARATSHIADAEIRAGCAKYHQEIHY